MNGYISVSTLVVTSSQTWVSFLSSCQAPGLLKIIIIVTGALHMAQHIGEGQRTIFGSEFSFFQD